MIAIIQLSNAPCSNADRADRRHISLVSTPNDWTWTWTWSTWAPLISVAFHSNEVSCRTQRGEPPQHPKALYKIELHSPELTWKWTTPCSCLCFLWHLPSCWGHAIHFEAWNPGVQSTSRPRYQEHTLTAASAQLGSLYERRREAVLLGRDRQIPRWRSGRRSNMVLQRRNAMRKRGVR